MKGKKLAELSDQELLGEAKKVKSNSIIYALLIGCVIGIVVFGVAKNKIGFFALIPLYYFGYKIMNNPENDKYNKELDKLLKERNLK